MKHLLTLSDLTVQEIMEILEETKKFKQGEKWDGANGKIVSNLFFENSTRTLYSFVVAEEKLDMKAVTFDPGSSSLSKGESFYDTVKTFDALCSDVIVIRHGQNEYYKELIGKINKPILNGGDGTGNHPTQSLLDLYTIYEEYGKFEGLKIAIVGDIAHSRVAHTNIEVMKRLGMEVHTSGPKEFAQDGYSYIEFDKAIEEMDIIMLLRVQHERHKNASIITKEAYHEKYGVSMERVRTMKDHAIIMHPAPVNRGVEIADDVMECHKSRIFPQMENGVYVRMAVIKRALGGF